jgi:hypothetical protein
VSNSNENPYADVEFWRSLPWWPEGRAARVHAGLVGHDREIVVNIDGYGYGREEEFIPVDVSEVLKTLLPEGWMSENRGTRIEIHPSGHFAGGYSDGDVEEIKRALGELGLVATVPEPMR